MGPNHPLFDGRGGNNPLGRGGRGRGPRFDPFGPRLASCCFVACSPFFLTTARSLCFSDPTMITLALVALVVSSKFLIRIKLNSMHP
jgi:hypothetical protein